MLLGSFTVLDHFAQGGLCNIYRAIDEKTGRFAIVKRVKDELRQNNMAIKGFKRECEIVQQLDHPNLNRGLDVGEEGGVPYLILEYIDGVDLSLLWHRAVERNVDIPESCWLYVIEGILKGLAYTHALKGVSGETLGVVHRDISPKNIFLDVKGEVRVGDFGAIYTKEDIGAREAIGSPGYMAPEQVRFEPLYPSTDIFAVGCVLFELMTHRPAFFISSKASEDIIRLHREGRIAPIPDSVPEDIARIIRKATQVSRADRYQTCDEMLSDVMVAQGRRPVLSPNLLLASVIRGLFLKELEEQKPDLSRAERDTASLVKEDSRAVRISIGTRPVGETSDVGVRHPDTSTFVSDGVTVRPNPISSTPPELKIHADDLDKKEAAHVVQCAPNHTICLDDISVMTPETEQHLSAHHGDFNAFLNTMLETHARHFDGVFWAFFDSFFKAHAASIADLGTGPALLIRDIAQRYQPRSIAAVEAQPAMLDYARTVLKDIPEAKLYSFDLSLPKYNQFEDQQFDMVTLCRVLHEIQVPSLLLKEAFRVLKPGGVLVFTDWVKHGLETYLGGAEFSSASQATHFAEHCRYDRADLHFLLRSAGFTIEQDMIRNGRFIFLAARKPT